MGFLNKLFSLKPLYAYLVIFGLAFVLYAGSINHDYALDDHLVTGSVAQKGFKGIIKAFKTRYYKHQQKDHESSGYRPITIVSFALEYGIFGAKPNISHFINILIYCCLCVLLFHVLARLFVGSNDILFADNGANAPPQSAATENVLEQSAEKQYNLFWARLLAFATTLLFVVHPLHSEVVCNVKSRDELLAFLLTIAALNALITWLSGRKWHIVYVLLFFSLALLAKKTALPFMLILPLAIFLFRLARWQYKYLLLVPILVLLNIGIKKASKLDREQPQGRTYTYIENPLYFSNFGTRIPAGLYVMGEYTRKLCWPTPLLYYYGYNNIPIVGWGNIWVWVSLLLHGALLAVAVWQYNRRPILAFALLSYLGLLFVFSNILKPAPGIIADRFMFSTSFAFCLTIVYILFMISLAHVQKTMADGVLNNNKGNRNDTTKPEPKHNNPATNNRKKQVLENLSPKQPAAAQVRSIKVSGLFVLALLIVGFSAFTLARVPAWKDLKTLFETDMPQLQNSAKANMLYADLLAKKTLNQDSSYLNKIERHYKKSLSIYPDYMAAWNNLGFFYMKLSQFEKAQQALEKAAALDSTSMQIFYNLGHCAKGLAEKQKAIDLFNKVIAEDKTNLGKSAYAELYNIYYNNKDSVMTIKTLERAIADFPNVAAFREELEKRKND